MSEQRVSFPSDLVARIKIEYPDHSRLHNALEAGLRVIVAHELVVAGTKMFTAEYIMQMMSSGRSAELLVEAEAVLRRSQLHADFVNAVFSEKNRREVDKSRP